MFFDGDIGPESIRDLSSSGDVANSLPPKDIQAMEDMIDNYICILQERRKYFTEGELTRAAEMDEWMREERSTWEKEIVRRGHSYGLEKWKKYV